MPAASQHSTRKTRTMKSLLQLEAHECRFPVLRVGEPEGFCAEAVEGIDSYCKLHRQIAGGARIPPKMGPGRNVSLLGGFANRASAIAGGYAREREHEPDLVDMFGGDR